MSSRKSLVLSSIVCSILLASGTSISREAKPKPNILFIMSDDHTTQAFGIYGSRLASLKPTPNLDKLANEGMIFASVFCNNSICTPSRASIITGRYGCSLNILSLHASSHSSRTVANGLSSASMILMPLHNLPHPLSTLTLRHTFSV